MPSLKNLALFSVVALALAGCSSNADSISSSSQKDGSVDIVATTDVYANIAETVAGDVAGVEVTPIIASTSQDPHSYEATASDRLAVKDAEIVVINGGGYDLFMEEMAGSDKANQPVVNAVKLSGLIDDKEYAELLEGHDHAAEEDTDHAEEGHEHHDHASFNEHVWYNFDAMGKVALDIAEKLAENDADNAAVYRDNAEKFVESMKQLSADATSLNLEGKKFVSSEPVPNYLLSEAGMDDHTPAEYVEAVEAESDVAPLTLQEIKDQISGGNIALFGYNEQTETAQTAEIRSTAESANVPTISFTETLPEGKNYVEWMQDNLNNLKDAVA